MASRPGAVRAAVLLMYLVALGYLVDAGMLLAGAGAYPEQFRQAAAQSGVDPRAVEFVGPMLGAMPYGAVAISAAAAAFLIVVARSVRAGHEAGRVLAWVGGGLGLLCSGCALAAARTPAFSGVLAMNAYSGDESGTYFFEQRLPHGYPLVHQYVSAGIAGLAMIALVLVIVLLALPSANWYFRGQLRRADVWPHPIGDGAAHGPGPAPGATSNSGAAPGSGPAARSGHVGVGGPVSGEANQVTEALRKRELALLVRRHQRGELTDEEFETARRRLLDQP